MSLGSKESSKMSVRKCYIENLKGKLKKKGTDRVKDIKMNMSEKAKDRGKVTGRMKRKNNHYSFQSLTTITMRISIEEHTMPMFNLASTEEQQKPTMTLMTTGKAKQ